MEVESSIQIETLWLDFVGKQNIGCRQLRKKRRNWLQYLSFYVAKILRMLTIWWSIANLHKLFGRNWNRYFLLGLIGIPKTYIYVSWIGLIELIVLMSCQLLLSRNYGYIRIMFYYSTKNTLFIRPFQILSPGCKSGTM